MFDREAAINRINARIEARHDEARRFVRMKMQEARMNEINDDSAGTLNDIDSNELSDIHKSDDTPTPDNTPPVNISDDHANQKNIANKNESESTDKTSTWERIYNFVSAHKVAIVIGVSGLFAATATLIYAKPEISKTIIGETVVNAMLNSMEKTIGLVK